MEIMFKVTNMANNEIRRVNLIRVNTLFSQLSSKVAELFQLSRREIDAMQLMYRDCANDLITFSSEAEMQIALREFSNAAATSPPKAFPVFVRFDTSPTAKQQRQPEKQDQEEEDPKLHKWVICDGCQTKEMRGNRYKCDECDDYDLCETCFASGAVHTHHNMRVIRGETAAKQRAQRKRQAERGCANQMPWNRVEIDLDSNFCEEMARKLAEFQTEFFAAPTTTTATTVESANQATANKKREEEAEQREQPAAECELAANYAEIQNSLIALELEDSQSRPPCCLLNGASAPAADVLACEEAGATTTTGRDPDFVHVYSNDAGSEIVEDSSAPANQNSIPPTQILGVYNTLINMGFTNEQDWLIAVIKQNDGDFNKILNFMEESKRNSQH